MTPEEQILHALLESETEDLIPPFRSMQPIDVKVASKKRDKLLAIKVTKKVAECPECKGTGKRLTMLGFPISEYKKCDNCKGTGSITQEFTIKELIEGD